MKKISFILIILLTIGFAACKKKDVNPNEQANSRLLTDMANWYYWYQNLPAVTPSDYESPVELMKALRYKELDRWSYVTTKQEIDAYYNEAEFFGYGIGLAFDQQERLWITFIYNGSPLKPYGVERGWRIVSINNQTVTYDNANALLALKSATFKMLDGNTNLVEITASQQTMQMNTVLMDTVYAEGIANIGYFVLKGFINPTVDELNATFNKFAEQNVSEIIVDLRYNGGGLVSVSNYLANLLAGKIANQKVFASFVHNNKHTDRNTSLYLQEEAYSLPFDRAVFITTKNSASASELVINCLSPYLDVTLVGSTTHGKPVGMYIFRYEQFDWAFVPICFSLVNANNEADYFNGIPVNISAEDGINHPFGSLEESSLAAAYELITGTKLQVESDIVAIDYPQQEGLRQEIGAW